MNKKITFFVALALLAGSPMMGFSKSASSLRKVAAKLQPVEQSGAKPVKEEILRQFQVADYIEQDIAKTSDPQKLAELSSVMAVTYSLMGLNFDFLGEREFALFFYEKAYNLEPNSLERILDYATELGQHGRYDEAITFFETAQKTNDMLPFHHSAYGYVLFQKQDYNAALTQFELTMQMNPQSRDANYALLMTILCQTGLQNKVVLPSKETLTAFDLNVWPGPIVSYLTGKLSEKKLKTQIDSQSTLEAQKKLSELFYYLGELYLLSGKEKKATQFFSDVIALKINSYRETEASKQHLMIMDNRKVRNP